MAPPAGLASAGPAGRVAGGAPMAVGPATVAPPQPSGVVPPAPVPTPEATGPVPPEPVGLASSADGHRETSATVGRTSQTVDPGPVNGASRPPGRSLIRPAQIHGAIERWRDHRSSPEDRQRFRASLGWRYDAAAQYVTRMLSDRPVLRQTDDGGLAADLAAVQYFTNAGDHEMLRSIRAAGLSTADTPLLSCLVSGLRRLPALTGPVLRGGPSDPSELAAYQPGTEVAEPGPLLALTDVTIPLRGNAEVLIWSTTARQLQGLTDATCAAAVMFLPGTTLRVLGREGNNELTQILMVEVTPGRHERPDPARDERITSRLRSIAAARLAAPPPPQPPDLGWALPWLAPLPGMAPLPGAVSAPAKTPGIPQPIAPGGTR